MRGRLPGASLRSTAAVVINGLPLIFEHWRNGDWNRGRTGDPLLETVRIYHAIEPGADEAYRTALVAAYQAFCQRRSAGDGGA